MIHVLNKRDASLSTGWPRFPWSPNAAALLQFFLFLWEYSCRFKCDSHTYTHIHTELAVSSEEMGINHCRLTGNTENPWVTFNTHSSSSHSYYRVCGLVRTSCRTTTITLGTKDLIFFFTFLCVRCRETHFLIPFEILKLVFKHSFILANVHVAIRTCMCGAAFVMK